MSGTFKKCLTVGQMMTTPFKDSQVHDRNGVPESSKSFGAYLPQTSSADSPTASEAVSRTQPIPSSSYTSVTYQKREEKMSHMVRSCAPYDRRRKRRTGRDSSSAAIGSTTQARWQHQQQKCWSPNFYSTVSYPRRMHVS